jgi:hypothetical protein
MVAAAAALVAERKCNSWCMDKLTVMPTVLSMVAAAAAWAHVTTVVGPDVPPQSLVVDFCRRRLAHAGHAAASCPDAAAPAFEDA